MKSYFSAYSTASSIALLNVPYRALCLFDNSMCLMMHAFVHVWSVCLHYSLCLCDNWLNVYTTFELRSSLAWSLEYIHWFLHYALQLHNRSWPSVYGISMIEFPLESNYCLLDRNIFCSTRTIFLSHVYIYTFIY